VVKVALLGEWAEALVLLTADVITGDENIHQK
jgi:hypothetical protein